jgi:hypothetical protein
MTMYHYLLFDYSDHVDSIQTREVGSEEDAVAYGVRLLPSIGYIGAVEVWQGRRRVYRVQNLPAETPSGDAAQI